MCPDFYKRPSAENRPRETLCARKTAALTRGHTVRGTRGTLSTCFVHTHLYAHTNGIVCIRGACVYSVAWRVVHGSYEKFMNYAKQPLPSERIAVATAADATTKTAASGGTFLPHLCVRTCVCMCVFKYFWCTVSK